MGSVSFALQVLDKYKDIHVKAFLTSALNYGTENVGEGTSFSAYVEVPCTLKFRLQ